MIDWDGLVLGPTMNIFGQPVVVTPSRSQPSAAPYVAQGIFKADATSIPMDDGTVIAATIYTLGVRLSDYAVPMMPEDQIVTSGLSFQIDRVHPDGQGGATLTLKRLT